MHYAQEVQAIQIGLCSSSVYSLTDYDDDNDDDGGGGDGDGHDDGGDDGDGDDDCGESKSY